MDADFTFSANNYFWCVAIDQIFSHATAEQWPNFQLTTAMCRAVSPACCFSLTYLSKFL